MGNKIIELIEERKESVKVVGAFLKGMPAKAARSHTDGTSMFLHGHKIAWHGDNGAIHATMAGYGTKTTRDRLNTLTRAVHGSAHFHQKNGVQHYKGNPINSDDVVQIREGKPELKEENDMVNLVVAAMDRRVSLDRPFDEAIKIKPSHKGLLHKDLGVKGDKKISVGAEEKAKHSANPAVRKRATFALNARKWHHEEVEPIEEISKKTLDSYRAKASKYEYRSNAEPGEDVRKFKNRVAGLAKIASRKFGSFELTSKPKNYDGTYKRKKYEMKEGKYSEIDIKNQESIVKGKGKAGTLPLTKKMKAAADKQFNEGILNKVSKFLNTKSRKTAVYDKARADFDKNDRKTNKIATNVADKVRAAPNREAGQAIVKKGREDSIKTLTRMKTSGKRMAAMHGGNSFRPEWPKKPKDLHYMGVREENIQYLREFFGLAKKPEAPVKKKTPTTSREKVNDLRKTFGQSALKKGEKILKNRAAPAGKNRRKFGGSLVVHEEETPFKSQRKWKKAIKKFAPDEKSLKMKTVKKEK